MATEAQLRKIARDANEKLAAIEDQRKLAENLKLVGRHFKYRNSYSCPRKPSDYWWLYTKVIGADARGLRCFEFQIDRYGKIEIEPQKHGHHMAGHVEIDESEFRQAWGRLLHRVDHMPLSA